MELKDKNAKWPDPAPAESSIYEVEGNLNIFTPATINFSVAQSEWCGYEGECKKDMAQVWDICFFCKYRKELDIPAMLEKAYEEQEK